MALGAALPLALERTRGSSSRKLGPSLSLGEAAGTGESLRRRARDILVAGAIGGALADVDILIRSDADPLMAIQFHRHFTHSLAFAPVIGAVVAACLWLLFRGRREMSSLWKWATLGALTHGLLDACTSYGTHLLWPFTNARVSWHVVSIIDPIYTLPLVAFVLLSAFRGRLFWARLGLVLSCLYLAFGWVQRERADSFYRKEIARRGHQAVRVVVKPSFGNLWLWRGIYEADGLFYLDAIRNPPLSASTILPGTVVQRLLLEEDFASLPRDSVAFRDLERFRFFSDDFLYRVPGRPGAVGDLRFSLLPNSSEPLWVVKLGGNPAEHLPYITTREVRTEVTQEFGKMLWGR